MPTSTWSAQASWDAFTYTPPPAGVGPTYRQEWRSGLEVICLPTASDLPQFNAFPDEGNWALSIAIDENGFAVQTVHQRGGSTEFIPFQWANPLAVSPSPFLTGAAAALTAGGTLIITKDYDAGLVTFVGPLGTQTIDLTLPAFADYYNTTPLRPRGIAARFTVPDPTPSFPAIAIDDKIRWYDMIGKENGATYETTSLSAADPGLWWPIYYVAFDPTVGATPGISFPWSWTQLASREETRAQASTVPGGFGFDDYAFGYRVFDTWRYRMVPSNNSLDMAQVLDHGPFYAAIVYSADPTTVRVRKSYDNGASWQEANLYTSGGTINKNPSLVSASGRLIAAWQQSGSILQSNSPDLGASWSTPVTLFSGTNPRLIVDPRHKTAFYFYIDGSGDLKLLRSGNFGANFIDAAPIAVASSVGQQTVTAGFAADGSVVVGYIASGAWTQLRSRDYGVSWA